MSTLPPTVPATGEFLRNTQSGEIVRGPRPANDRASYTLLQEPIFQTGELLHTATDIPNLRQWGETPVILRPDLPAKKIAAFTLLAVRTPWGHTRYVPQHALAHA